MRSRKFLLPVLIGLFTTSAGFCQTEVLKGVVNNLAYYKQKKDLKYLSSAKNSVDSLLKASPDTLEVVRNVYRAVVYSSILYVDSLNKLHQPASLLPQTAGLVDRLSENRKIYRYPAEMDYAKRCLSNAYVRLGFSYLSKSDFLSALRSFQDAKKYTPSFGKLNAYIAYADNKLGNLQAAAKYYAELVGGDSTRVEYVEAASNIYKSFGDTVTALNILKKGRKVLPNDKLLLLDEANIYNNRKDYRSLVTLLPALLDNNTNNADIAFAAADCYDHLNQYEKAESLYLHAIELNSSAYEPIFNLGLLYFKQSELKQEKANDQDTALAMQWLEKAHEISPNDINCLRALQLVYEHTGRNVQLNTINDKLKQLTNQ